MVHHITILEHDRLVPTNNEALIGSSDHKKHFIDYNSFEELKTFVSYEENHKYLDVIQGGKALQVKQYVGVIETHSGITIEVLPKIAHIGEASTRKTLLKMLRRLKHSPFKHLNSAHLDTDKMHLLEIFIAMFNEELSLLIKKGIVSSYQTIEENTSYMKGKLKIKEQLQRNGVHKERFYVNYDSFETNRIENQLIKSTLGFLMKKSGSSKNKKRLREFLFVFEGIDAAKDPKIDFSKVTKNRQLKHYEAILKWCELFLNNKSFVSFKGDDVAFALFFDMNRIFEDYVAYEMKKQYPDLNIKTQHSSEHLLVSPSKQYRLRPDLVIEDNIVADTKWKLVNSKQRNYGLAQSDLYQMFAYGKKYCSDELYLIYPKSENFSESQNIPFQYEDNMRLKLLCFDCEEGIIVDSISYAPYKLDNSRI